MTTITDPETGQTSTVETGPAKPIEGYDSGNPVPMDTAPPVHDVTPVVEPPVQDVTPVVEPPVQDVTPVPEPGFDPGLPPPPVPEGFGSFPDTQQQQDAAAAANLDPTVLNPIQQTDLSGGGEE